MRKEKTCIVVLLIVLSFLTTNTLAQKDKSYLHVQTLQSSPIDSITYWKEFIAANPKRSAYVIKANDNKFYYGNRFIFRDSADFRYISLGPVKDPYGASYLMEPGDSIYMVKTPDYLSFSGRGVDKYLCVNAINTFSVGQSLMPQPQFVSGSIPHITEYLKRDLSILGEELSILNAYKEKLTKEIYAILKVNLICAKYFKVYKMIEQQRSFLKKDPIKVKSLDSLAKTIINQEPTFSISAAEYSDSFPKYFVQHSLTKQFIDQTTIYEQIITSLKGIIRDKTLLYYFDEHFDRPKYNLDDQLLNSLAMIGRNGYADQLRSLSERLGKGMDAKNFILPDEKGRQVRLSEFKGKVVFLDFWYTGCMACSIYFDEVLSKVESHFDGNPEVVFLTVNIDKDRSKWLASIKSGKYTGAHSINLYTEGLGAKHPVIRDYHVGAYPKPLLLDRKGRVFSNSDQDLRTGGPAMLIQTIEKALKIQ